MFGLELIITLSGCVLGGLGIGYGIFWYLDRMRFIQARSKAETILSEAKKQADAIRKDSEIERKELLLKEKSEFEREQRERKRDLDKIDRRLVQKEENLDRKQDRIEKKDKELYQKEKDLLKLQSQIDAKKQEYTKEIEKIANLTVNEAREMIISGIQHEAELEAQKYINKIEGEAQLTAERKARKIVVTAIQRTSTDIVTDTCVSSVALPSDDMKGRIIGREGRNIRALESLTGVDIIIDDTPEAIILSSFDPIRREVARQVIQRLIADGRIHPARIEEMVGKISEDIHRTTLEMGEQVCFDLGITGMNSELMIMIGRMHFRSSYGQNLMQHSKEVAHTAAIIASEVGADSDVCKRAGILHDIGKTIVLDGHEGSHAIIGAEIAKKYGESDSIINAIACHHNEVDSQSVAGIIIQTADAISASRPGARKESYDNYINRLESLERIANNFDGVEKAFAIQAGRELRIFVGSELLDDLNAKKVARDIARKIEDEVKYPGQIKITLIRETRVVEYAR